MTELISCIALIVSLIAFAVSLLQAARIEIDRIELKKELEELIRRRMDERHKKD